MSLALSLDVGDCVIIGSHEIVVKSIYKDDNSCIVVVDGEAAFSVGYNADVTILDKVHLRVGNRSHGKMRLLIDAPRDMLITRK